jgi:hypothetical protein
VEARRAPGKSRETVERETLAFMAKMPAWKDHPRVRAAAAAVADGKKFIQVRNLRYFGP